MKNPKRNQIAMRVCAGLLKMFLLLACLLASVPMRASTDYGPAIYREAYPGHWYTSGNGKRFYVIHDMEGYYLSTISYLQRSTTQVSIHYCANGLKDYASDANPGEITQMVRDAYYAWHVGCWNRFCMGTEHEGFVSNPAWYTEAMYQASAALTRSKCDKYGIARDRNHIIAHGQKLVAGWSAWAGPNLGINPTCNDHTDPGPYWNWTHYMNLVNGTAGPPTINPPYVFDSNAQGWTAGNSMTPIAWTGTGWPGIIYNDQVGNDAFNYTPPMNLAGGGDPSVNVSVYPQSGNTANHDMQLFWKTAQDNTWTASKSTPIVSYSAQNAWVTLNLDVNANWPGWFGKTVNQMRLDFDNNNSGTRWIVNHVLTQTTPRFWFGGGTDGWVAGNSIVAPWWTDCCGWPGVLVADQNGNDGFIVKDINSLGYRGAQNDRVYVRLYPQGGSGVNHDIKLYWATQLENFYSETKSTPVINFSAKDAWVDIWFDVGANGYWYGNGPLTGLRLDFDANNQGVRWIIDQIQVVHNGSATFAPYNNASIVSISAPATVNAGQTFSATVVMNNSGNKVWNSDGTPHGLGSQNPQDNNRWGFTRVALPGTVNPGQNATFTFNATAPATIGTYAFDWKMVEDGIQWFGPIAQRTITVISPGPNAPSGVAASAAAYNQVNVTWVDNSANETGFKVQRSTDNVNFTQVGTTTAANVTSFADTTVAAGTTYYYRVRSTNSGGDSAPSNTATVTTPNAPPVLGAIGNKTGTEGQLLTFTASSSNPNQLVTTTTWATFEGNNNGDAEIVFRKPANSPTTSGFMDGAVTNYTSVASSFPAGGGGARVLKSSWSFKTGTSNYWMRLTTAGGGVLPNPVISQDQILRFKIYSTKALKVGLGVRETGSTGAYGSNGGTTGTIDWTAVTNVVGGAPIPSKLIAANTWTTLDINIPFEAQAAFTGNGVVSSGKGVLEHLALRGEGGTGVYEVYLDDFAVVEPNTLTYSLDAGAPAGASIHPKTGVFKWTPSGQSGNHTVTVRVTDRLGLVDFETITLQIISVGNHPPVLAAIGNKSVNEGSALSFTATATDQDAGQTLTFSLLAGAPSGASITTGGVFSWTPTEAQGPGSYPITIRVADNGSPSSNDTETITVTVGEVNIAPSLATIADQSVNEGSTLNITASATDADVPANSITYSLDAGAPVGMSIGSSSGAISWTTSESHGPGTYPVTVRATDSGGLSDAKTFNVTVNEVNIAPVLTLNTTITSVESIADFEAFQDNSYNGTVLFRQPSFSSSTSAFLDPAVTNITKVTTSYPGGDSISKALYVTWSFKTGTTNPWLRLATFNTSVLPNPTVNFNQRVRFKIHTDKALGVALGLRETDTGAGIGQNGGTVGTLEWAGATATAGTPVPTRTVAANTWTTLEFNLPNETISIFTGNGTLTSTTGKGVLEHLALTPAGGSGVYNVYLDNIEVVTVTTNLTVNTGQTVTFTSSATDADFPAQALTFSLATNAPAGALINSGTGDFSWTPTAGQGPSTNVITVRVTDNGPGNLSDAKNITVIVKKVNSAPRLAAFPDQGVEVQGGSNITLTATAEDDDLTDTLTYSLQGTIPPGASIGSSSGIFSWTPTNSLSTNVITVRVTDNGVPPLYDEKELIIIITPTNATPVLALGAARATETVATFEKWAAPSPSGNIMFRVPIYSSSTTNFLDTSTNYTKVVNSYPAGHPGGTNVLRATWGFKTGTTNPWLRLSTGDAANIPNPTLNLGQSLRFDIYSDKAIKVALGIRETGTTAEIGANGGTTGGVEWLGAAKVGTSPNPSRTVNANVWTTLEFTLPAEVCTNFSGGNSVLATGKGVLEHLALVPAGGMGAYNVYLDNFQVVTTTALPGTVTMYADSVLTFTASATDADIPAQAISFGLDADAPAGTSIDQNTGAFTWTPTSANAGTTNVITVFANDQPLNGAPVKSDSKTLTVIVKADLFAVQSAEAAGFAASDEIVTLTWDAVVGESYRIEFKNNLGDAEWQSLETVTATESPASATVSSEGERYYRIVPMGDSQTASE